MLVPETEVPATAGTVHMPPSEDHVNDNLIGPIARGTLASPVAWLIGIPWTEASRIRNLLGTRAVLNEFVAYTQLGLWKSTLTPRPFSIATFALCGFANLGSIGMQICG